MSKRKTPDAGVVTLPRVGFNHPHQVDLSPELIDYYHSILRRFSDPIVEMRNGVCMGCCMVLSPHNQQKIKSGEGGYDICEACGRIVHCDDY